MEIKPEHLPTDGECPECGESDWERETRDSLKCPWCNYIHVHTQRKKPKKKEEREINQEEPEGTEKDTEAGSSLRSTIWTQTHVPERDADFPDMTLKQKTFCEEYIIDFNGTRAAKAAGYSEKSAQEIASENLTKPIIQRYLLHITAKRKRRLKKSQDDIIAELELIKERCLQAKPVYDRNGIPTGEWVFKEQGAIKTLELMGKHLGMFITQKLEHTGKDGKPLSFLSDIALEALSQEQLDQLEEIVKTSDEYKEKNPPPEEEGEGDE